MTQNAYQLPSIPSTLVGATLESRLMIVEAFESVASDLWPIL